MVIGEPELWRELLEPGSASLLKIAADSDPTSPADVERLRRDFPPPLVSVALELTAARRVATRKFPDRPELVADVQGVEQATSALVAEHKARRLADAGIEHIDDLCCGIGGDAMAFARYAAVRAVDLDPVRAWMTAHNAVCRGDVADIESIDLDGDAFHVDPARRDAAGSRLWRLEDVRPGPAVLARLLADRRTGAIKLGPGVDLAAAEALADAADGIETEIEIINEAGTLVQAVLWSGALVRAPGQRTATRLPSGETFTAPPARLGVPLAEEIGRFLILVDPAVERAELTPALCRDLYADLPVAELAPGLGVLTAPESIDSPWMTCFEVVHHGPWRERKLKAWLRANGAGVVDVKTRGGAVKTDAAQRALRGGGDERYVVFGLRLGRAVVGIVTRRVG